MRKILFYLILLVLGSCSTPSYFLTTDIDEQAKSETIGGEVTQTSNPYFHHTTYTYDGSLKELLVPAEQIEKSGFRDLGEFLFLCNQGKFKQAEKILAAQNIKDQEVNTYLEGLILFLRKKHSKSIDLMQYSQSRYFALQYELLLLDNEYEIQKKRNNLDKSYFIQQYQKIIDTYTLDQEYSEFVNARIKSLRYS